MSIFLATSRGKYTWKQTPGQSVLIFGKIIGTHCDRRDARNNTASRNRDMFWQTAIPTGTNAFQTTQRVCCRLPGSDDSKGLQLPLLCMERAGAPKPSPLPSSAREPGIPFPGIPPLASSFPGPFSPTSPDVSCHLMTRNASILKICILFKITFYF